MSAFEGVAATEPFFIVGNEHLDGSVDVSTESSEPYSLAGAIDEAKHRVNEHGGTYYIIECRAIRKVVRGKPRVLEVGK